MPVTPARHHTEWLSLLDISGPFLSLNVLLRVFPQELDGIDPDRAAELRSAYEEWLDNKRDPAIHQAWVRYVLASVLELPDAVLHRDQAIPETTKYTAAEHGETIRPDWMIARPTDTTPRMLVMITPPTQDVEKPITKSSWQVSPAAKMRELLAATGVRLGLVTNGEQWMLVDVPRGGTSAYISWYASLWNDERVTLRAFISLLGTRRFFGVPDNQTLEALLTDSADDAQEVTDQLGKQVRRAVEILIQSLDRMDREDPRRTLLTNVSEAKLYEAALTVMMRLVFLMSAEERGLFLLGERVYDQHYAVSTLSSLLREEKEEELLEHRYDAWSRLLATFRAVYGGVQHQDLPIPAYGGSLFDPDRFPFLEGRGARTTWRQHPADPLPINNRVVLHLLEAIQFLQVRAPGGGVERRRLSFRALDIEQIGHVYEGLLDHEARRATEPMLGLTGAKNREPEVALSALEGLRSDDARIEFLKEITGRSVTALRNGLRAQIDAETDRKLHGICADDSLYARVLPYAALIRDDDFGMPVLIKPDSVYVTEGATRRATGTHYTPRALTEPIVQHTLEPVIYIGASAGLPREQWELKTPADLLRLNVCDMAMGSGAFLVQACRYLAARLVEAWDIASTRHSGVPHLTVEGMTPTGAPSEIHIPADPDERLTLAHRLIADRCLYGVDKNPLAVEMAKLSLWLITLAKGRPFTFLDHALKAGDSLVGVSLEQLSRWNLDATQPHQLLAQPIRDQVEWVAALRDEIETFTVETVEDLRRKAEMLAGAEQQSAQLRLAADHLIASVMNDDIAHGNHILSLLTHGKDLPDPAPLPEGLTPFHWELTFPEVFAEGGFDAFVGNPPFQGGQKITGALGEPYREYLVNVLANGQRGSADLCAYFFLHAFGFLKSGGAFGLIATNTIAQGDTREVGLDQINKAGGVIYCAEVDKLWPGAAAVVVDVVHAAKGGYLGSRTLDGEAVERITPMLDDGAATGNPYALVANTDKSFIGSYVLGMGFVLTPEQAEALIQKDPRNRDVLFPYLSGEDLNQRPDQSPSRWVINFFDWSLEQAESYPDAMAIVRRLIYEERQRNNRKVYRDYWWHYAEKRPALYNTIAPLSRVVCKTRHSPNCAFEVISQKVVFQESMVVFAIDNY